MRAAPRIVAVGLSAATLTACAERLRPLGDPDRWAPGRCVKTLTIEHGDSPLTELRELGGGRDDFQERFPAAVIDREAQRPVSAASELTLDGSPIAWFSTALDAVVLDGAAFAPLRRADPTRAGAGERLAVGRVTELARSELGPLAVVELLIRVGAIQTYWHLGADLCVREEFAEDGVYRARVEGVHHYASNRQQQARYAFVVEIDADDEVTVIGAPEL